MSIKRTGRILLALAVVWTVCGWNQVSQAALWLNVLFIGNSHTYYNDMPAMFRNIAMSGGNISPVVVSSTPGGYTLAQHLTDANTLYQINNGYGAGHMPWDYVILQEQSTYPAYAEVDPYYRDKFQSAANGLYDKIKAKNPNAKVILFETPAWHQSYFDANGSDPYLGSSAADMQARVREWCSDTAYTYIPGHSTAANKNDAFMAPIGDAWERNYSDPNSVLLHVNSDGDYWHPNLSGSYLGALTMYSTIYKKTPQGISYTAGLDRATADYLQRIAAATVVPEPGTLTSLVCGVGCLLLRCKKSRYHK